MMNVIYSIIGGVVSLLNSVEIVDGVTLWTFFLCLSIITAIIGLLYRGAKT